MAAGVTIGQRALLLPDSIGAEYTNGATILQLAAKHHYNATQITKKLASMGVRMRPAGCYGGQSTQKVKSTDIPNIVARYRNEETLESIAESYGVSRERVRQIVFNAGEPPRLSKRIERGIERAAKASGEIENRRAARMDRVMMLSALWLSGEPLTVIAAALKEGATVHYGAQEVSRLRKKHPDLFPYRRPNHHRINKAA